MPKLILNPLSAKLDYVSTKADLDLSGTNSGDVTVTDTSTIDFTLTGQALTGSVIQSGITHNNLGGLTTGDPHTQYALLLGRSGGQTLIGGTAANDDLTLEGTSSATRTTSYVILQPNGGNVGIGTTNPDSRLDLAGGNLSMGPLGSAGEIRMRTGFANNASGGSGITAMDHSGENVDGLGIYGHDGISFHTAQTERIRIASTGNVGIGTTSPSTLLHLQSLIPTLTIKGTGSGEFGLTILDGSSSVGGLTYSSVTGEQRLNGAQSYVYQTVYAGGSERMRITTGGNVGINDTAPSAQLHVDQTSTTAAKPTLRLQQADLSEEFIRFDATVGTGNPINTTALGTYYGRVRVYVEGVGEKWLALYNT